MMDVAIEPAVTATQLLANWCTDVPRDWSQACRDGARAAFIDTIAVILAGRDAQGVAEAGKAALMWGSGACRTIGGARLPAPSAALVNGTAAHALDYDDVLDPSLSHPSAPLVPALLALGEELGASGADCLDAYLVGFEVQARLGEAMNVVHYQRGWHTTLSIGALGTAAACARLMRLDADGMQMAISLATSMAGGSKRQFGSTAKPLHAGLAARNGIVAAQLAASGMRGIDEPLEGRWGYLDMMAGETAPGLAGPLAKLGRPPAMEEHGVWLKFYPCCASTHRPVDALRSLSLRPDDVVGIDAYVSEVAAANLRYRVPASPSEARFSLPYCLAVTLADGAPRIDHFTAAAIGRADLLPLMERVTMHIAPELRADKMSGGGAERAWIEVRLADGTTSRAAVRAPRGHPRAPLTAEELRDKFIACAGDALTPAQADSALAMLADLESLGRIDTLTAAFCP